jgi:DNA polymerase-3 subunit delta'
MPPKKKSTTIPLFTEVREIFLRLSEGGMLGHAYLFFGDKGIGKKTFALSLARFVESGSFEGDGQLIDSLVLAPGETGSISIDEIRNLKHFLSQTPLVSSRRSVLIYSAEAMTPEAQAACLKIVEEPPASALILFITAFPENIFPPLLSRVQKIYFPRLSRAELERALTEHCGASETEARRISQKSYGAISRARAFLETKKEKKAKDLAERVENIITELYEKNARGESARIRRLLSLLESLSRYNLNPRIQEKALEQMLHL